MTATGPISLALAACRSMLAATDQWQALATTGQPADRIYYDGLPAPDPGPDYTRSQIIAARPYAILWVPASGGYDIAAGSAGVCCPIQQGVISALIELAVPSNQTTPHAVATWANNIIGRIIHTGDPATPGLWDLGVTPGYLPLTKIQLTGFARTTPQEATDLGDAVCADLAIHWSTA